MALALDHFQTMRNKMASDVSLFMIYPFICMAKGVMLCVVDNNLQISKITNLLLFYACLGRLCEKVSLGTIGFLS